MTVAKLMKILSKCSPRTKICVHRDTFRHPLSEVAIFDVETAEPEVIEMCDDDGFLQMNKDGSQHYKSCVVLRGNDYDKETRMTSLDRKKLEEFEKHRAHV